MDCKETTARYAGYVDGELGAAEWLRASAHLGQCAACRRECTAQALMRDELRQRMTRHAAGPALRARVRAAVQAQADQPLPAAPASAVRRERSPLSWWVRGHGRGFLAPVASAAFAVLVTSNVVLLATRPSEDDRIAHEVVASHVRALFTDRPIDVESSDRHTVKPWYAGKLGFSPPVADYAAEGFALVGARLDSIDGEPVAALVYRRDKHLVDVFIWPAASPASLAPERQALRGHNVLHWSSAGMRFWAVSDLDASELATLQRLMSRG